MDFVYSIVGFFSSGGLFMYPILVVFAVGVAIAVERYTWNSTFLCHTRAT
jgi:biopolymer transport protein ExbB